MINELVYELVQIPGPTGFEGRVASRLKELLESHVDELYIDKIGNLIARKKGTEGKRALALVAHTDQVSMVVQKVDEFVWFDRIGWIDFNNLPGTPVLILGAERDIPGVVCASSTVGRREMGSLWMDVGDRQKFVSVGDPIVYDHPPRWLDDNKTILASQSIDDRVGCAVLVEVARRLKKPPRHDIYFVGAVQEEIGCFGVRHFLRQVTPDWFIALDTGFAQDAVPDIQRTVPMRTGLGVRRLAFAQPTVAYPATVNFASPRVNQLLIDAAKKLDVPFHVDVSTGIFSDHNIAYEVNPEIESTFMFVAARRYSHSPIEVADLSNAARAVDVLSQAIADMDRWDA
ncbi:MAG: M20/M25/M40 family metallo-hydrolase [Dehalococcoidales bacterium]|nr:M20/M25/M40 family metallo-hydrolase [Dehalococcoidales bacterium]